MAEVIRISESAEPAAAAALPQNVEAEAALLGALMIDNRLVEDVQLKLKPHHFFEPLHGRIYEAILKLTDRNMVANPVTLRPTFEADEAMKELGGPVLSGDAHRLRSRDHRREGLRPAGLRSGLASGAHRCRARLGGGRARHQ